MTVILASKSPRRQVLLRYILDDFQVESIDVEEVAPRGLPVPEALEVIARKKALAVSEKRPDAWVLAADTVVVWHEELINKARDAAAARLQLVQLMGGTHRVATGVALAWNGKAVDQASAVTSVHIPDLGPSLVDEYVASGAWLGKAGGYGIQDALLAPHIKVQAGPWSNVVGLPLARTHEMLIRNGIASRPPPDESWLRDHNPF